MTARKLYSDFHGEPGKKNLRTGVRFGRTWITSRGQCNILIPTSLAEVGRLAAVEYDTRRDGRTVLARHVFAPGCRPMLAAGAGFGEVFLLGTRFRWTHGGIVDFDANGKPIDYDEETGETKRLPGRW